MTVAILSYCFAKPESWQDLCYLHHNHYCQSHNYLKNCYSNSCAPLQVLFLVPLKPIVLHSAKITCLSSLNDAIVIFLFKDFYLAFPFFPNFYLLTLLLYCL